MRNITSYQSDIEPGAERALLQLSVPHRDDTHRIPLEFLEADLE
nr:hypothetical protein [Tanacetum cinerariifolium]